MAYPPAPPVVERGKPPILVALEVVGRRIGGGDQPALAVGQDHLAIDAIVRDDVCQVLRGGILQRLGHGGRLLVRLLPLAFDGVDGRTVEGTRRARRGLTAQIRCAREQRDVENAPIHVRVDPCRGLLGHVLQVTTIVVSEAVLANPEHENGADDERGQAHEKKHREHALIEVWDACRHGALRKKRTRGWEVLPMTVAPRIEVVNIGCDRNGGETVASPTVDEEPGPMSAGSLLSSVPWACRAGFHGPK